MPFFQNEFFSHETVDKYNSLGLTIDGTKGGLLVGHSHDEDGIPVLMKFKEGYRIVGEFEGNEYLLNPGATEYFSTELDKINGELSILINSNPFPSHLSDITMIDCFCQNKIFSSKFLIVDARGTQYVINKHSTKHYLYELENYNKRVSWKFFGEPASWDTNQVKDFEPSINKNLNKKNNTLTKILKLLRIK